MNTEFLMLVDQVKTVAIPDLGAVVKMGKKYTFNHFLKFNDGRFSKHLQGTGLSKEEADQKVEEWVTSIKESLTNNGSFVFEGMGILHKEGEGKFRWEQVENKETPSTPIVEQEEPLDQPESENIVNEIEEEPSLTVVLPQYESGYLSTHFDVSRAKDEIKRINNIEELTEFTKNDKRATVISAVEKQTKKINEQKANENQPNELTENAQNSEAVSEEPIDNEVKKQVENESKILETIKEKESEEKANEINVEDTIDEPAKFNLDDEIADESKEDKKTDEPLLNENTNPADHDGQNDKPPAKKKRKLFLVAMLLIISGTVIIGVIKYDQFKQYFLSEVDKAKSEVDKAKDEISDKKDDVKADIEANTEIVKQETINNDDNLVLTETKDPDLVIETNIEEPQNNIIENDVVSNEEIKNTNQTVNKGAFHLIVGSFNVESNANTFLDIKIKEGYNNSSVFKGPKNKYYVEIGSYSTKNEAINALSGYDIEAWVLEF